MHPVEHLRHLARARGVPAASVVREAALTVGAYADDHAALVTACRRLVARSGGDALLWWLAARVLTDPDPGRAAVDAVAELDDDDTALLLSEALPAEATVAVLGWPDQTAAALARRGDLRVLAVESMGHGDLATALAQCDVVATDVPESGLGAAVRAADLLVLEATAAGPSAALCPAGSHAAAAVAGHSRVEVWLTLGCGRLLPDPAFAALARAQASEEPWHDDVEVVPLDLVDRLARPDGVVPVAEAISRPDCARAAELA